MEITFVVKVKGGSYQYDHTKGEYVNGDIVDEFTKFQDALTAFLFYLEDYSDRKVILSAAPSKTKEKK